MPTELATKRNRGRVTVTALRIGSQEWTRDGACFQIENPDQFFPAGANRTTRVREVRAAASICAQCSTRPQCADLALSTQPRFGVYAGLDTQTESANQRKHLTQALREISAGAA